MAALEDCGEGSPWLNLASNPVGAEGEQDPTSRRDLPKDEATAKKLRLLHNVQALPIQDAQAASSVATTPVPRRDEVAAEGNVLVQAHSRSLAHGGRNLGLAPTQVSPSEVSGGHLQAEKE